MHLKTVSSFSVRTHHHTSVVDEDMKVIEVCKREAKK